MTNEPRPCGAAPADNAWQGGARGTLFIISAPSGAGKTTLVRRAMEGLPDLRLSVSYTTRKPRKGEVPGVDYHFVSMEEFSAMAGRDEFLESAEVHGNRYGTRLADLERLLAGGEDVILDIDTQGARQIKSRRKDTGGKDSGLLPDAKYIFILPPSFAALRERLEDRKSDSPEQVGLRLRNAAGEVMQYGLYDYVIVNDRLEEALERLKSVILARRSEAGRVNRAWVEKNFPV